MSHTERMKNTHLRTNYLGDLYDPARARHTFNWLKETLDENRGLFDTIAFTGSSGAIALAVGIALDIPVLHVRKDLGHSYLPVEGVYAPRYCIVDDFVSSGATVRRIVEKVAEGWESARGPYGWAADEAGAPELRALFTYGYQANYREGLENVRGAHPNIQIFERE
jgi:hypothetical protein